MTESLETFERYVVVFTIANGRMFHDQVSQVIESIDPRSIDFVDNAYCFSIKKQTCTNFNDEVKVLDSEAVTGNCFHPDSTFFSVDQLKEMADKNPSEYEIIYHNTKYYLGAVRGPNGNWAQFDKGDILL